MSQQKSIIFACYRLDDRIIFAYLPVWIEKALHIFRFIPLTPEVILSTYRPIDSVFSIIFSIIGLKHKQIHQKCNNSQRPNSNNKLVNNKKVNIVNNKLNRCTTFVDRTTDNRILSQMHIHNIHSLGESWCRVRHYFRTIEPSNVLKISWQNSSW